MLIGCAFIRLLQVIPLSGFIIPVPKIKNAKREASAQPGQKRSA
jgi:hypothetical protein